MGKSEFPPIGQRLKEIEASGHGRNFSTVSLTENYILQVNYSPLSDSHVVRLEPTDMIEERAGMVTINTSIQYDHKGNFTGLVRHKNPDGNSHSVLNIWVSVNSSEEVMVDYDIDPSDPSLARIVNVVRRVGPLGVRTSEITPRKQWNDPITKTHLPYVIDIPTSIHRLVIGKDPNTGQDLTDLALETQPLVPSAA